MLENIQFVYYRPQSQMGFSTVLRLSCSEICFSRNTFVATYQGLLFRSTSTFLAAMATTGDQISTIIAQLRALQRFRDF